MVIRGISGLEPLTAATNLDFTAEGANIAQTFNYTAPANGWTGFRVTAYEVETRAATTSSTLPTVNITYTDADNSTAQAIALTPTNASGNTLAVTLNQVIAINAAANIQIGFNTTGYATSGATSMQYALHLKIEAVQ